MEDGLKINKMEDDLKHNLKKSTLIGCDIIVNYPSCFIYLGTYNICSSTRLDHTISKGIICFISANFNQYCYNLEESNFFGDFLIRKNPHPKP